MVGPNCRLDLFAQTSFPCKSCYINESALKQPCLYYKIIYEQQWSLLLLRFIISWKLLIKHMKLTAKEICTSDYRKVEAGTSSRGFSNWRFTLSACARITGTLIHVAVTLTLISFYKRNEEKLLPTTQKHPCKLTSNKVINQSHN